MTPFSGSAITSMPIEYFRPGRHNAVRSISPAGKRISPAFLPSTYTAA